MYWIRQMALQTCSEQKSYNGIIELSILCGVCVCVKIYLVVPFSDTCNSSSTAYKLFFILKPCMDAVLRLFPRSLNGISLFVSCFLFLVSCFYFVTRSCLSFSIRCMNELKIYRLKTLSSHNVWHWQLQPWIVEEYKWRVIVKFCLVNQLVLVVLSLFFLLSFRMTFYLFSCTCLSLVSNKFLSLSEDQKKRISSSI